MKKFLITFLGSMQVCALLQGAVVFVPSMSQTDMLAAAQSAHDGDTFIFPAGTAIYTATVEWTNAVTLKFVPGGSVIIDSMNATQYPLLFSARLGTKPLRVTGLSIRGNGSGGGIKIDTAESTAIRVDHCSFSECGYTNYQADYGRGLLIGGYRVYGVVDHCTFTNNSTHFENLGNNSESWNFSADPYGLGTTNGVVLEDNYFYEDDSRTAISDIHFLVSQGSRVCFRHNSVRIDGTRASSFWDTHGNGNLLPNNARGAIYTVIENNTLNIGSANNGGKEFYIRGGCFIMISNNITTVAPYELVFTEEECWYHSAGLSNFPQDYSTWPRQDQITNSWVVNNIRNGAPMAPQDVYLWDGGINNGFVQVCIQQGRDYWITNNMPPAANYTPLVYPHPLVSADGGRPNIPPVAFARAVPNSGATPLSVSFSSLGSYNPSGTALTYFWNFGDGNLATTANPNHTFATNGIYKVRFAISDGLNTVMTNLTVNATQ